MTPAGASALKQVSGRPRYVDPIMVVIIMVLMMVVPGATVVGATVVGATVGVTAVVVKSPPPPAISVVTA